MSDESVDTLAGLSIAENELERVMGELDEMYSRLNIHVLEWVSLRPLKWALSKLADDLHTVDTERRSLRIAVASARSEADEARRQRDAANEQHAIWVRRYDGEVERRQALQERVAEATAELDGLQRQWEDLEKSVVQSMQPTMASVVQLVEAVPFSLECDATRDSNDYVCVQDVRHLIPSERWPELERLYMLEVHDCIACGGNGKRMPSNTRCLSCGGTGKEIIAGGVGQ